MLYVMFVLTANERPSSGEDLRLRQIHLPVNERSQIMSQPGSARGRASLPQIHIRT